MMIRFLTLLVLIAPLFGTGCTSLKAWGTQVPMGDREYPEVQAEHVMILFEPPSRAYEQIGIVSSLGGVFASEGDMFKKMQSEAAELGADAIIVRDGTTIRGGSGVTVVQTQKSGWDYPKTNAIAIKYR